MPCSNVIARLLLKHGKAKCVIRTPFTIKLTYETTEYTQPLTIGQDSGSTYTGNAVTNEKDEVFYISQVEVRNDITDKMKQRYNYRRTRRNRKTRYRKPRFKNRKNSTKKDRLSPTLISKIDSHLKEIRFIRSILPITKIIIETANFDPHALKNPAVLQNKWLYQHGINYGYSNTKAYVLDRDNHTCQHCNNKLGDKKLEVHHIIFRSNGGSDEESNLITLCKTCHTMIHNGKTFRLDGKRKSNLKYATQMNSIRIQLLKALPQAEETFGFITKEQRQLMNLPKTHYCDAIAIASTGIKGTLLTNELLFKKCVSKGDYQQTKGSRSEKKIPTGKIQGFRKFDKVSYLNHEYFIKGRMSTGYAILMNIKGETLTFNNAPKGMKTPKLSNLTRISARKYWLVYSQTLVKPK